MTKFKLRATAMTLMVLTGALSGCHQDKKTNAQSPNAEEFKIIKGDFHQNITLSGELDFLVADKLLTPRTPTWRIGLTELLTDGSKVKKGDVVAEFDRASILQSIDEKKSSFLDSLATVSDAESDKKIALLEATLELKKARLERNKAQLDAALPKDLQSEVDFSNRQLTLHRAENALLNASTNLKTIKKTSSLDLESAKLDSKQRKAELILATKTLEKIALKAPKDGVWVVANNNEEDRKIRIGDTLWPSAEVGKISNLNNLIVKAWLHDVDAGSLNEGMKAHVVLDAYPQKTFEGHIASIALMASPFKNNSLRRKFDVIIELTNPDVEIMRPGLSASVSIDTGHREDVYLLPRLSLTFSKNSVKGMTQSGKLVDIDVDACNEAFCALSKDFNVGLLRESDQ